MLKDKGVLSFIFHQGELLLLDCIYLCSIYIYIFLHNKEYIT